MSDRMRDGFDDSLTLQDTLNVALRRQRSVLHIVAGDEEWDPTDDQLEDLIDLVISADMDPVGAVIATKKGIEISEMAAREYQENEEDGDEDDDGESDYIEEDPVEDDTAPGEEDDKRGYGGS